MQKQRELVRLDKRRANAGEQTDRLSQQRANRRAEEWDWENQLPWTLTSARNEINALTDSPTVPTPDPGVPS
jgi:hypothetical protein